MADGKQTYNIVVIVLEKVEETHDVVDEVIRKRDGDANKGRQDQFKYHWVITLATQNSR